MGRESLISSTETIRLLSKDDSKDEVSNAATTEEDELYESALQYVGFGKFHARLACGVGLTAMSQPLMTLVPAYVVPALECDPNFTTTTAERGLLSGAMYLGLFCGGCFWGTLADKHGRKPVLMFVQIYSGVITIGCGLCQSFLPLILLHFLLGIGLGGAVPTLSAYLIEFQPKRWRGMMAGSRLVFWVVGQTLAAIVALVLLPKADLGYFGPNFTFNSWRIFYVICGVPAIICAVILCFLPESPKFYAKKGRILSAHKVLRKMYEVNKSGKGAVSRTITYRPVNLSTRTESDKDVDKSNKTNFWQNLKNLFHKDVRRPFTIVFILHILVAAGNIMQFWMPELFKRLQLQNSDEGDVAVCQLPASPADVNGTTNNATAACALGGVDPQVYVYSLIAITSTIPGYFISIFFLDLIGRKMLIVFGLTTAGVSMFLFWFVNDLTQAVVMAGVFGCLEAIGWTGLGILALEILPTNLRALAVGVLLGVFRLGTSLGTIAFGGLLDTQCTPVLLGVAAAIFVSGLTALALRDTSKMNLR